MPIHFHLVAAPGYFAKHGRPSHPAELERHFCMRYTNVVSDTWRFTAQDGVEVTVRPSGILCTNSGEAMLPALREGVGIALLPDFIVGADLTGGTLEAVLTEWKSPEISLHLITPPNRLRPRRVEVLIAFLVDYFSQGSG